jgi:hypothetical protein
VSKSFKWTQTINEISKHCIETHCLVSALAGLNGNDTQKIFLDAAVQANVQRFIQAIIQPILQT